MHRSILLSNAYRQASENPSFTENAIDPDNHLLWRFDRNRLEAEVIRDSILFVSGRLNGEMGGPSIFPLLPTDSAISPATGGPASWMWSLTRQKRTHAGDFRSTT